MQAPRQVWWLHIFVVGVPQCLASKHRPRTCSCDARGPARDSPGGLPDGPDRDRRGEEEEGREAGRGAAEPPIGIEKLPDELRESVPQLREKAPGEADAPIPRGSSSTRRGSSRAAGANVTAFGKLKTLKLMLSHLPPGSALLAGVLATFKPEGHFSTLAAVSSRLEVPVVATLSLPAAREHIAEGSWRARRPCCSSCATTRRSAAARCSATRRGGRRRRGRVGPRRSRART